VSQLSAFKGVIFDMDGVLCDSEPFICEAACKMFERFHGVKVQPDDFLPFIGMGEERYVGGVGEKYGLKLTFPKAKLDTYEVYLEIIRGRLQPLPGVLKFVSHCKSLGLKVAVASSADMMKVKGNLTEVGLPLTTFDAVVCGDDVEKKKPAPDIFLMAAKRIGLDAAQCLVVEDAPQGIRAGKAALAKCLGITSTFSESTLREAGADWIARDLTTWGRA